MHRRTLGPDGPEVSEIGLGCMGMSAFYGGAEAEAAQIAQALPAAAGDRYDEHGMRTVNL